jgi:hypothetical protein
LKLTKNKKVMKQYTYLTLLLLLQTGFLSAQIGIGTQLPDESSILDIESKNKGVLFPRVTTSERDQILSPANALLIYNTSVQTIQVNIGTKINPNWVSIGNNQNTSAVNTLLTSGKLFVGDETNIAKEVSVSGDATLSNIGVLNINNSAVISKTLTNYTIDSGPINASNTILQAIQKLDGNQRIQPFRLITENYIVLLTDSTLLCDTELKSFTINLPDPVSCAGKTYIISKIDESYNELNINPSILLTKSNSISKLNYSKFFKIQSDGLSWQIIN